MYGSPQEPWQYQSVFVALPRHESLCNLSTAIVKILLKMLHKINALVRHFVWQRDRFKEFDMHNVCLQLIGLQSTDGLQQNMPTLS